MSSSPSNSNNLNPLMIMASEQQQQPQQPQQQQQQGHSSTRALTASSSFNSSEALSKNKQDNGSRRYNKHQASARTGSNSGQQFLPPSSNSRFNNNYQGKGAVHKRNWGPGGGGGSSGQSRSASRFNPNQASMTKEDEIEFGSVFKPGSKKQNLNHLLNFTYEPRGTRNQFNNGRKSSNNNKPIVKYSKEHYLQANCQFVVKAEGDYSTHLEDPDTLVNWDLIEEVCLKTTTTKPSCPICLHPPVAAKITRCGHIYCWSCMLHYLALSDDKCRKCPICDVLIYKHDLKSVVSVPRSDFKIGDEIEMVLMRRDRNSLFAVPVDKYFPEVNEKHPHIDQEFNSYSQLVLASSAQVANTILARERAELQESYEREKDEPEVCFIEEALMSLEKRTVELLSNAEANACLPPLEVISGSDTRPRHESSSGSESIEDENLIASDLDLKEPKSKGAAGRKETFYFYQSSDGQPIFLHAINVQMLVRQFGSFEDCPRTITGKILEKDQTTMTPELRHKLRYLRHLPVACYFEVAEMKIEDLKIDPEIMDEFRPQLEERNRKRAKRAREEKRREKRILVEENKLLGKFPEVKLRIESEFHFPQVGSSSNEERPREVNGDADDDDDDDDERKSGLSFAKMLREGKSNGKPRGWLTRSETFPVQQQQQQQQTPSSASAAAVDEDHPEGYVPPPPKSSIGDALALALEKAAIEDFPGNGGKKRGKKGNKGRKIVLSSAPRPMM